MLLIFARLSVITCFFINANSCFQREASTLDKEAVSSGFSIKGVSMVAPVKPIDSTVLQPIVNVNANSIAIMPYAFCTPEKPLIRYNHKGQWWGESDEGVVGCIQLAHGKNLSVMLKPHLWIAHGMYTGIFALHNEKDWRLWEDSYRDYILHFAAIADSTKAELFCIGTELGATVKERPAFWRSLIDSIKQKYHGKLTYAANWDDYDSFPFWEKLDYIGVDAYFPLVEEQTPDVESLKKRWRKHINNLQKISSAQKRPVIFTEYGYRNVDNNSKEPWKENEGNQNDQAQANAFEALYQSFSGKEWFKGGFVWKWYVDTSRHGRAKIDFTPQQKVAEKVIRNWYSNK